MFNKISQFSSLCLLLLDSLPDHHPAAVLVQHPPHVDTRHHQLQSHCLWLVVMLSCHAVLLACHAVICKVLMLITRTCWTTFVFMSMLKSHCLWLFVMLSYVKCLFWSLGHVEQPLFSCLGWKLSVYRWKWQCFFWTSAATATPDPVTLEFTELVPS